MIVIWQREGRPDRLCCYLSASVGICRPLLVSVRLCCDLSASVGAPLLRSVRLCCDLSASVGGPRSAGATELFCRRRRSPGAGRPELGCLFHQLDHDRSSGQTSTNSGRNDETALWLALTLSTGREANSRTNRPTC